jgi:hypothetical protein
MSEFPASAGLQEPSEPLAADTNGQARAPLALAQSLVTLGIRIAVAAAVAQGVIHLVNNALFDARWSIVDAGFEKNIPTWASASAAFTAAVAAFLIAETGTGSRRLYLGLAAILAFFSLDDSVGLHELIVHERVGEVGTVEHAAGVIWPLVYLPLLLGGLVLLIRAAQAAAFPAKRVIQIGLGLLGSAVALEFVGVLMLEIGFTDLSFGYAIQVAIEEGFELAGWILIASGLLAEVLGRVAAARSRTV